MFIKSQSFLIFSLQKSYFRSVFFSSFGNMIFIFKLKCENFIVYCSPYNFIVENSLYFYLPVWVCLALEKYWKKTYKLILFILFFISSVNTDKFKLLLRTKKHANKIQLKSKIKCFMFKITYYLVS